MKCYTVQLPSNGLMVKFTEEEILHMMGQTSPA
jgi:hypothetical protein